MHISRRKMMRGTLGAVLLGAAPVANAPGAWAEARATSGSPLVGVAANPSGKGYWETAADGGVFAFGDADFFGSMGGRALNAPVVGIAAMASGNGYWLAAADGGVFAFGDADHLGGMAGKSLNRPMIGIAAPGNRGYWLTAADGGVFTFGNLDFHGSLGSRPPTNPVTAMAATPSGDGYWLATSGGEVFAFGEAVRRGSMAGTRLAGSVNGMAVAPSGDGYWLSAVDGGVFAFGDAGYHGRAAYVPRPAQTSRRGGRAARLALGWVGLDYRGADGSKWGVPGAPEHWCADFVTYVWQQAGIDIDRIPWVPSLEAWGRAKGRWSTDLSTLALGDAVIYPSHTGLVVDIRPNNTVVTADGNWGGSSTGRAFATSSRVRLNPWTWAEKKPLGAGGMKIRGFVRAG